MNKPKENFKPHSVSRVIVVMGVSGCGKSTIAKALAAELHLPFLEGDDYHPPENIQKMSNGIGLNDEDRWPWLDALGAAIHQDIHEKTSNKNTSHKKNMAGVIVSCSALKRSYRERLKHASNEPILFIHLDGNREILLSRMQSRTDHYMPSSLLDSQLKTLEKPADDECAMTISIENSPQNIVKAIILRLSA